MTDENDEHWRGGGPWTEIKLDAIEYYLDCYTKALSHLFDLWYVDAFAGSGKRMVEKEVGGLLEGGAMPMATVETLDGSARRALAVVPPFHHFRFIEKDRARCQALLKTAAEHPRRDILVLQGDANEEIKKLLDSSLPIGKMSRSRGVVFLDPYALQVDWDMLRALAGSGVLDVWYLFPVRDVSRQLAIDYKGIGAKKSKLDRTLPPAWQALYKSSPPPAQLSLLEPIDESSATRHPGLDRLENWFKGQLEGEFEYVSEPLPLLTAPGRQAFSLFLCVSNPSAPAIKLAKHFAGYVMKNYAPASRRKSGR